MSEGAIQFDHVHIISQTPEATASWFVDNLGGKISNSQEIQGAPQIYLEFEGARIIVRGQRPGEAASPKGGLEWGSDHFAFKVSGDFDGYCAALKEKGVKFTVEPRDFGTVARIAFIEAPDGVSIELLQRK
ncbi:MAG: VOC family protein [bacterium]